MKLLSKDSSKLLNIRSLTIILIVVGILGLSGIGVYSKMNKTVTISDDGTNITVKTTKNTVKDVLEQNEINLTEKDCVEPSLETVIADNSQIVIKRAVPLTLVLSGQEKNIFTNKKTVQEVLDEQQIVLNENDKLNIDPTQAVTKNLILKVIKVKEDTIVEKEPIAFKVSERYSTQISRGTKRVITEGKKGQKEKQYKVVYEDNDIVSKELIKEKVISKPVNAVVEIGIEPKVTVSRGESLKFTRVLTMQASAYTAGYESTRKNPGDPGYGRTATGIIAQRGVVAVDPKVIPLGTRLYIESLDGFPTYGYAVAADRGGAIKGNKIDLFYESLSDALQFGRRSVKVYVLE